MGPLRPFPSFPEPCRPKFTCGVTSLIETPLFQEPLFAARVIYDLLFFFMVIIIVLNLIFGVIIDTFADLRSEKQKKEEILKTTCFICGECGGPAVAGKPGPTDWRGGVQALGSEGGAAASSGHWALGAGGGRSPASLLLGGVGSRGTWSHSSCRLKVPVADMQAHMV